MVILEDRPSKKPPTIQHLEPISDHDSLLIEFNKKEKQPTLHKRKVTRFHFEKLEENDSNFNYKPMREDFEKLHRQIYEMIEVNKTQKRIRIRKKNLDRAIKIYENETLKIYKTHIPSETVFVPQSNQTGSIYPNKK